MQNKELEKKISPKKYNEYLKHVDIADIYLKDFKSTLSTRIFEGKANLQFEETVKLISYREKYAIMENSYLIKAKTGRKNIFKIEATYTVVFKTEKELPKGFFEIYNTHSLPLQTFPYLRELVNSTISKMGLPPLILPLRKHLLSPGPKK